jgi:nitroreductase
MSFFDVVKKRCSVRQYSERSIDRNILESMVDAGRCAPTARGEEPWEFVVVVDKKKLVGLAQITDHGRFLKDAQAAIIIVCKETKYYLEDGCAATENILLAATDLGIGSCWIAGDKKPYSDKIMQSINVPGGYKLVSIIALGYPKHGFISHQKRTLEQVLHWERF